MKKGIIELLIGIIILVLGIIYYANGYFDLRESQLDLSEELRILQEEKVQLQKKLQAQEDYEDILITQNEIQTRVIKALMSQVNNDKSPPLGIKERIPSGPTNFIGFMDYRKITNTQSWQYQLLQECSPEPYTGIYTYYYEGNHYKCVALGSAYGKDIGDTWKVTLENDFTFYIILSEYKDPGPSGSDFFGHSTQNYLGEDCTNVIEFIVDSPTMSPKARSFGTFNSLEHYGGIYSHKGNIKEFKYLGRIWQPN